MNLITLSIPIFFLLIALEVLVHYYQKSNLYRLNDAITNISLGIGQQVTGALTKTLLLMGYTYLYQHHKLFIIPHNALSITALFISVDFFYYWFHRASHQINIMWGAHVVHHQSQEYNLSVALRQSWFQSLFSWVFYLPLALVGFNPVVFVSIYALQTLYQFWIHTKTIGTLGPLEWVLNTPSHHRVHHGQNPIYIDKNHAGTFIIWDRLFGTFQKEIETVQYGVTIPLNSWNPLWANFDYWKHLHTQSKTLKPIHKLKLLVALPGWQPHYAKTQNTATTTAPTTLYDTHIPTTHNIYILIQYAQLLAIVSYILFQIDGYNWPNKAYATLYIMLTILSLSGIFETKKWTQLTEPLRHLLLPLLCLALFSTQLPTLITAILSTANLLYWLWLSARTSATK